MTDNNDKPMEPEHLDVVAEPARIVPKLVTKIGIAKTESGNMILTFLFDMPNEKPFMIERIVMDDQTVNGLITSLNQVKAATNDK